VRRDWSGAAASQVMPKTDSYHQKPERAKKGYFPTGFRESMNLPKLLF
jgi:hypothetical protein